MLLRTNFLVKVIKQKFCSEVSPIEQDTIVCVSIAYLKIYLNFKNKIILYINIMTLGLTNLGICDTHEIDKQKEIQFKRDYNDFRFKLHQVRLCR